ncbi:MAG: Holliday junction branch migration DNA helicase RuvB [Planctomycetota bacterium]
MEEPLIRPDAGLDERGLEIALRPRGFDEFVGQPQVKRNLAVYIAAARERGDPLDHLLLSGLPGLGKTTLAEIVAREMGGTLHTTSGPALDKPGDLAGLLTNLERGDVLFVDEIHRLPAQVEEFLYSAMEDFAIDIVLDQGPRARSVRIDVAPFTLVGATTREGLLSPPFRDRFGVLERLEPYPVEDLTQILARSARLLEVALDAEGALALARNARGTPRIANRFLRRIRDLAQVERAAAVDPELVRRGLAMLGVDDDGLLRVDRRVLETIASAGGIPVGLKTLAITVGEDERTLEDVYEPHLIRRGLILKTPRGRILTPRAAELLGAPAPPEQRGLFDAEE